MINKLLQIFRKIKIYMEYHGLRETFHWLWSRATSKLKKKLGMGQGISAATPPAYAAAEQAARTAGKVPVQWPDYREYLLTEEEAQTAYPKLHRQVFIFGTIPYYDIGGGQRSSQLAKTFNKLGFPVHYYYGFESSDFDHKSTMLIPCVSHMYVGAVDIEDFKAAVRPGDLLILEGPVSAFVPFVQAAKELGARIIYENIDNWETSLGSGVYSDREDLNTLLRCSDVLVGTAKLLVQQLEGYCRELQLSKEILYLPNAVDDELFAPLLQYELPKDMVPGSKTLLYYGSLWGEWFDWDLVFGIAKADPSVSINLIGDFDAILHIRKTAPSNVHFLGLKKQTELPAYLSYADFALIPFKPGAIGDYVSPLKVFEYIAMNTPVLTTALPDLMGYPNVYAGNTVDSWMAAIRSHCVTDTAASQAFTLDNTWSNRIQNMLDKACPETAQQCMAPFYGNISVVILNYNNKNIIDKSVASLLRYNTRYHYEIVVVDNGSADGSYEQLRERFDGEITLVRNSKNGCSSGRNLGVANATKDYILFLDSDQWVVNHYWLDSYLHAAANAENFGAVGWYAGWFNKYGAATTETDAFPHRYMPPKSLYRADVGYLATCGFFIEKALFTAFDGFDEAYDPTCYEDTDLSLKVRHAGREIYYCPHLGVVHLPHQTTKAGTEAHARLIYEKQNYFTEKWKQLNPALLNYIKQA